MLGNLISQFNHLRGMRFSNRSKYTKKTIYTYDIVANSDISNIPTWMFLPLDILFEYWKFYRGAAGCRLCNWLPLQVLVWWINHLPLGCWPNFGNLIENFIIVFYLVLTYILMPHNMIILYFHLPYFHVSNSALFFPLYSGAFVLHRRSLNTFY